MIDGFSVSGVTGSASSGLDRLEFERLTQGEATFIERAANDDAIDAAITQLHQPLEIPETADAS